jgi:hypothetical protein
VDKWPAYARLSAVAPAGHLPTAPTPLQGTRPVAAISDRQPGDECEIRRIGYWPTLKVADKHAKQ